MGDLISKLHPANFAGISGKMSALVGCILGETFTTPHFVAIQVTSDGFVIAQCDWDVGLNDFIGSIQDFRDNWKRLLDVSKVTDDERAEANALFLKVTGVSHEG